MINKLSIPILSYITGLIIIITGSAFMGYRTSGSPGGYSGSPLDTKDCTNCHNGTPTIQTGIITSNIDTSGYVPGSNYTITISVPGSGNKGFEVQPLNSSNQKAGTLTAGTSNKLTNSSKAVTQSTTKSGNPAVWTFQWTAPASGMGTVTFYGAFAAGTSKTLLSTMVIKEKKLVSLASEVSSFIKVRYESGSKMLNFETNTSVPQTFSARIYSIEGKEVQQIAERKLMAGNNNWSVGVSGFEKSGMYILKYNTGKFSDTKKVFIY